MIPGVAVAMGGRDWIVPPLTLGQLRRLMPKVRQLTEIGASMGEAQINVLIDIVARRYSAIIPRRRRTKSKIYSISGMPVPS